MSELKPCICGKCTKQGDCVTAKLNNVSICVRFDEILKPCPCGKPSQVLEVGQRFRVYCEDLRCYIGPSCETKAEAITTWNTRPEEWDSKEWPVQTHLRSKTMDEHIEKIRTMFGDELNPSLPKE